MSRLDWALAGAALGSALTWWALRRQPPPADVLAAPTPDYPHGEAPAGYGPALAWSGAQRADPYLVVGSASMAGRTEPLLSNGVYVRSEVTGHVSSAVAVDALRVDPQWHGVFSVLPRAQWTNA